jgi:uncharacterized protein (UPF0335 family)
MAREKAAGREDGLLTAIGGNAAAELRNYVERVERLTEEKKALTEDIGDVLDEAKSKGFDKKMIRAVIKLRAQDQQKRREEAEMLEVYCSALGLE